MTVGVTARPTPAVFIADDVAIGFLRLSLGLYDPSYDHVPRWARDGGL